MQCLPVSNRGGGPQDRERNPWRHQDRPARGKRVDRLHVTGGEEALAISLSAVCTAECPRDKLFSISLAAFSRIV